MDLVEQLLQGLKATAGDTRAQSAVAAEFVLLSRPEPEPKALREALDAASVLRWFDVPLLSRMLSISETEALHRFEALKSLPFVEPFRRGERDLRNVHEATRLGWRRRLAREDRQRFKLLSRLAADYFAGESAPGQRIEWIYHRLGAEPDTAADELESLDRQWTGSAHPEDFDALTSALNELEDTQLVAGAARVEVLLCVAEVRNSRGETSRLEEPARMALAAAESVKRVSSEARAHCLLGDVLQAQGKLAEAQAAFGEFVKIRRRLADHLHTDANRQRELAVAHSRVGDMLQAQGKPTEAQVAFADYLKITRRLAECDPCNASWQKDLAVAYSRVGDVLQAQGKLAEAQAAFGGCLKISRRLAELDPNNAGWQSTLAVAYSRVGDVVLARGNLEEGQVAFGEYLKISRRLAARDPSNAVWQRELAVAHSRVGHVLQAQGKLEEAQAASGACLRIIRRMLEHDPSNAGWQMDLAVAHSREGDVLQAQGKLAEAQVVFGEYLKITRRLAERDPLNAGWQRELAVAHSRVGGVLRAQGKFVEARMAFDEWIVIRKRLSDHDPSDVNSQRGLALSHFVLAELESETGRDATALPFYEEAVRILDELLVQAPGFAQWSKDREQIALAMHRCRLRLKAPKSSDSNPEHDSDGGSPANSSPSTL